MKSGSLNISGMPYRRSGHAGGKSVSMISMLVLLMAALLVLPSCFDDDDEVSCGTGTVEQNGVCVEVDTTTCGAGTEKNADGMCVASNPLECGTGTIANSDGMCVPNIAECGAGTMLNAGVCEEVDTTTLDSACGEGTTQDADSNMCVPVIVACGTGTTSNADGECVLDTGACADGTILNTETGQCETDFVTIDTGTCEDAKYMGSGSPDKIMGTDEKDCIDGEKGDDSIKGLEGMDEIAGGPGNDTIYGGAGNDTLDGGAGNDTLMGETDDDELIGGSGDNTLDGGAGKDIAVYKDAIRVVASLSDSGDGRARVQHDIGDIDPLLVGEADDGTGTDILRNIEDIKGSLMGDDIINGNDKANVLKGLDGADRINGNGGNDTIIPNRPEAVPQGQTANDGVDTVDGGEGSDTISYEGEASTVVVMVDLNDRQAAEGTDTPDDSNDDVIAHAQTTVEGINDRITLVNVGTEEMENIVTTIENIKGGAGNDMLYGDARANEIYGMGGNDTLRGETQGATTGSDDMLDGGDGDDMLYGGPGDDMLIGGAGDNEYSGGSGDDTFVVTVGDDVDDITEAADGGMDTLLYMTKADVSATPDDESEEGVGSMAASVTISSDNIEVVIGTPNADYITANTAGGATIVGCGGSNVLTGAGGDDIFGVYNDGTNADEIREFSAGDEIHLKGFAMDAAVTFDDIGDNRTHAAVKVNGDTVATVTSSSIVADIDDGQSDTIEKSLVQKVIDALGKNNAKGMKVVRIVDFTPDKCVSN